MEQIENIRAEVRFLEAEIANDQDECDWKGATRAFWWQFGLERALAMLEGAEPTTDPEIEAWYLSRKAGEGAGQ